MSSAGFSFEGTWDSTSEQDFKVLWGNESQPRTMVESHQYMHCWTYKVNELSTLVQSYVPSRNPQSSKRTIVVVFRGTTLLFKVNNLTLIEPSLDSVRM